MHPRRRLAFAITALFLLVGNTYSGFAWYAFTIGATAEATVTGCSHGKFRHCRGRWTLPDGTTDSGGIAGASSAVFGSTITVRIAPVAGAYADRPLVLWSRMFWAIVIDSANILAWGTVAFLLARGRRKAIAFEREIPPDHELWRVRKQEITDRSGQQLWLGRKKGRHLNAVESADGARRFLVHADKGILRLEHPDGTPIGHIEANRSTRITYTVTNAADESEATITNTSIVDSTWAVTGSDDRRLAEFILAIRESRLAFEPNAPEHLRPFLAAFLLDHDRLLLEAGSGPITVNELRALRPGR